MIAAAGTGGHVYPGLSVAEALVASGVRRDDIVFVGGDRLEADVYPAAGFPFLQVELAGLKRSLTLDNMRIPGVVRRAGQRVGEEIDARGTRVVLGMGGYVTIPVGWAARRKHVVFFNAEQNAEAGLANRVAARWARATFVSFPDTGGLSNGEWVGNPVRQPFWEFDREALRGDAVSRYDLDPGIPTLGVFGGSLGAKAINDAIADMLGSWGGGPLQVVHLTGSEHLSDMEARTSASEVTWRRVGFEDRMDLFYAAVDLVVARAGGAVAELTATATPSVLVPGSFGSGGHQDENARALARVGAGRVVTQDRLHDLAGVVDEIMGDSDLRTKMAQAATAMAKPQAALTIARVMREAVV